MSSAALGRSEVVEKSRLALRVEGLRVAADRMLLLTLPVPLAPPERFLDLGKGPAFVWDPPEGDAFAGLGIVAELRAAGPDRFVAIRDQARELFARIEPMADQNQAPPRPRLFGGFAFGQGTAAAAPWSSFGDAFFVLPRFAYERHGNAATLTVALWAHELSDEEQLDQLGDELEKLLKGLAEPFSRTDLQIVARYEKQPPREDPEFRERVAAIVTAIASGRFEKVVAARRVALELDQRADAAAILRRLQRGRRASTLFAFRRGASTIFLGATPERLIKKSGRRIETEALAGSRSTTAPEGALLKSGKDRREQQLVVDDIARRLTPFCRHLEVAHEPTVRELRDVAHLLTPIHGELGDPATHLLDLVAALHPTPAVGGVARSEALDWIAAHEPDARGWYAGPIGFFDSQGDGDFLVALRSCLIDGQRAFLWAGAGIVADSDPASELAETELKLRVLESALLG